MATPDSLLAAIQALHAAIADHPDPQAKATLTQALTLMMRVQAQDHQQPQGAQSPQAAGPPPQLLQALLAARRQ